MNIEIKNSLGVYKPLDLYDDFRIEYNHQYEDYKDIGAKKIPYTNKFKIPLTPNNRDLCGVPFDASPPLFHSVDGKVTYTDGSLAFAMIMDIDGQTINVLEPYIEVSIIDLVSKAISDFKKWKMSDLLANNTFNIRDDDWVFGTVDDLDNLDKFYSFPYFNFNNKSSVFGYDGKRNISQLQPTFVLNKLVRKMFEYVGLEVNSDFLNLDDQLDEGIKADDLAMMIPCILKTFDNFNISANQGFSGRRVSELVTVNDSIGNKDRSVGVSSVMPTSSKMVLEDFTLLADVNSPLKLSYDYLSDSFWNGESEENPFGKDWCSTVDGKIKINISSNNNVENHSVKFGGLQGDNLDNNIMNILSVVGTVEDLEVRIVNSSEMDNVSQLAGSGSAYSYNEQSTGYDVKNSKRVGIARYLGLDYNNILGAQMMEYEIIFDENSEIEFEVKANENICLGLIVTPMTGDESYTQSFVATNKQYGGTYNIDMIIQQGFIEYKIISSTNGLPDENYTRQEVNYTRLEGSNQFPTTMAVSFIGSTSIPSGFSAGYGGRNNAWVNNVDVDMSESMKSVKDYSFLDIIKMIMERFNLQLYTNSNGELCIDTSENRKSGTKFVLDHLIHEAINVEFSTTENGVLSIKDTNPSFYDEDFNRLDGLEVSENKRNEVVLSFKSSIVNSKMFNDTFDNTSLDLLKYKNDTDYWGVADREQVKPKELKPAFCLLELNSTKVFTPFINNSNAFYVDELEDSNGNPAIQIDFGFYNTFHHHNGIHKEMSMSATNVDADTDFRLVSFKDKLIVAQDNTLYKKTWQNFINNKLNDNSIAVSLDIYVNENSLATLLDFPTIVWKGQDWEMMGFNKFPLSNQNGGLVSLTMVKIKNLAGIGVDPINPSDVNGLTLSPYIISSVSLSWNASIDAEGIDYYEIWRNENGGVYSFLKTSNSSGTFDLTTEVNKTYCYKIKAVNTRGTHSLNYSNEECYRYDNIIPTDVTSVTVTRNYVVPDSAVIYWTNATDDVNVKHYRVQRAVNGAAFSDYSTTTSTLGNWLDADVNLTDTYNWRIKAVDTSDNESLNWSNIAILTSSDL
jgi:hypothetical protein